METDKNIETEPELVSPTTEAFRHALQVKIMQRDRIINRVASLMDTQLVGASVHQLEANRMLLEKHFDTFQSLQCEIEMNDHEAFEQLHRDQFEESYCAVKAIIAQRLEAARDSPTPHFLSSTAIQHQSRRVNLPKLQLPKFGGLPKEWLEFHNMFQVLVHQNSDLSNIEKFQYLKSCLTDKAAKLIQSLEVTSENYTKAVDLLITRYNDKRYIFQSHLQEIFTIRHIQNPTVSTLREFIDIVNANLRALQSLATSQQIMDGILLQLVTSKLDPETQAKWEEETSREINSQAINQRFPTWEDLTSFMERRCQTISMIESSKPNKVPQATVSQSSRSRRVNSSFVATGLSKCSFCNESHHHTPFKCQHFMALDALARYHKVKALKLYQLSNTRSRVQQMSVQKSMPNMRQPPSYFAPPSTSSGQSTQNKQ